MYTLIIIYLFTVSSKRSLLQELQSIKHQTKHPYWCNWVWFKALSSDMFKIGKEYTLDELALQLKKMVGEEQNKIFSKILYWKFISAENRHQMLSLWMQNVYRYVTNSTLNPNQLPINKRKEGMVAKSKNIKLTNA